MSSEDHDWGPVRRHLRGARVVVISNRVDRPLQKTLERLMGVKVKWVATHSGAGQRRLESLCKSFSQGTYDLVLALSGFVSHYVDAACSKAARRGNVTYVRVNKGRPLAVLRALQRDLGLE